jgi:hypothetical protein
MKLHMIFLLLLVSSAAYTQCTQCGGSRVDVQFNTATLTEYEWTRFLKNHWNFQINLVSGSIS